MKRQIIAIGGGGFGRNPGEGIIERYILDQSKKASQRSASFQPQLAMMRGIKKAITQHFQCLIVTQCIWIFSKEPLI